MEVLSLNNLSKAFSGEGENASAIKSVSLTLSEGDSIYIQGEDKHALTGLIMLMGLVIKPDSGSICIEAEDAAGLKEKARAALRNRYFGYISDSFPIVDSWSVIKNVSLPLVYSKERLGNTGRRSRTRELLDIVGLSDKARTRVGLLTRNERIKMQVARAFVNNSTIILADNPLEGLEHGEGEEIMELIFTLLDKEKIFVMAAVDSSFSDRFSHRLILKDGTLMEEYWGRNESGDERVYTVY